MEARGHKFGGEQHEDLAAELVGRSVHERQKKINNRKPNRRIVIKVEFNTSLNTSSNTRTNLQHVR
jgi:hypothetical protein